MIAPCDPHGPSAVVVAGGGAVFFGGDRRKKSLRYFNGLGWVAEIRRRFGKNTEPDPPRRETEGLGEAPPPRLFPSALPGVSLSTTTVSTWGVEVAGRWTAIGTKARG